MIVNNELPVIPDNPMFFIDKAEYKYSCFGTDLAAAVTSELNPKILLERLQQENKEIPRIYMACGDQDSLLKVNQDFADFLESHNVEHTFEIGNGNHEWDFWDKYILKALEWLPLEGKELGIGSGNVGI